MQLDQLKRREFPRCSAVRRNLAASPHARSSRRCRLSAFSPSHWRQWRFRTFLDWAKGIKMSNYQVKSVEPVVVGTDIQVRVFTLADGDVIPWHYHSESTDHYFVLRGQLTIETRSPDHRHRLS